MAKIKRNRTVKEKKDVPKENVVEHIFTLYNIYPDEVLLTYYGAPDEEDEYIEETMVEFGYENINITDLLHENSKKSNRSIMFLDPHKGKLKYWINMIDMTQNGPLPLYTSKPCWHCRSSFTSHPIGCPIKYHPHKTGGLDKKRIEEKFIESNLPLDKGNDFFDTEGVFCTFPCVKAYILDQISRTRSNKYKISLTLLTLLYFKLFGSIKTIPTASTWKVLVDWGGHMTPRELRAATGMLEYTETINTVRPYMYCSSTYIKENRIKL